MATIPATDGRAIGRQVTSFTTLDGSGDTFTVTSQNQLLILENDTGADITVTFDGDQAANFNVPSVGTIDLSAGLSVLVADGTFVRIYVPSVKAYLNDADNQPAITGGTGLKALLLAV